MKNTAKYKFTARKIIEKLTERLKNDSKATYADWIITLMREGFKKDDAIKAFCKSDFVLLRDGTIIDKKELHKLKVSSRLVAEKPFKQDVFEEQENLRVRVDVLNKMMDHEKTVNRNLSAALNEAKFEIHSLEKDVCRTCASELRH